MPAKLKVENLRKRYGAVQALDGVSFHIEAGEILGLLGPNGAGKTTAVESIAGLCEPDSGGIEVCGVDARRNPNDAKRRMGLALSATALQDKITPREAVESYGAFYRRRAGIEDLLARFEARAARLPVLLTLPMIIFILPCVFLIVAGPAMIDVYRALAK